MTTCTICGRELTDPKSISRGVGPECLASVKSDQLNQGSLFASRSRYDYYIQDDFVVIMDLGGGKSVTSDLINVLNDIEEAEGDITTLKILYRDSDEMWDGVKWKARRVEFIILQERMLTSAMKKLILKW